ncbi:MAG: hypothetical protein AAFQ80_01740 [Cyanobacteria bacterium J06621_8]
MPIPTDERRDDIVYFLLNKVKESGEEVQDISYAEEDFGGKKVSRDEVKEHLQLALDSKYLEGEMIEGLDSVWITCKDAKITTEGRGVLRSNFFKV